MTERKRWMKKFKALASEEFKPWTVLFLLQNADPLWRAGMTPEQVIKEILDHPLCLFLEPRSFGDLSC